MHVLTANKTTNFDYGESTSCYLFKEIIGLSLKHVICEVKLIHTDSAQQRISHIYMRVNLICIYVCRYVMDPVRITVMFIKY